MLKILETPPPSSGPPFQNFKKFSSDLVLGDPKTILYHISSKSAEKPEKMKFGGIFGVFFGVFSPQKIPKLKNQKSVKAKFCALLKHTF